MEKIDNFKVKLRRHPYKGLLTEIAREQGVSPQAIWTAVNKSGNMRIMEILSSKMRQRKLQFENMQKELQAI